MRLRIHIASLDRWQELAQVLRRNRLRTVLTALAVAWGIFMLIILLGAGKGLQNSVEYNFRDDAQNSIFVRRGETSIPFKGRAVGRPLQFTTTDYEQTKATVPEADHVTARFGRWGLYTITSGNKSGQYRLRGVHPDHLYLEKTIMVSGRYINDIDIKERRKVCVISEPMAKFFFGKGSSTSPLGKRLNVAGISYQIVGTYTDAGGDRELEYLYLPITTAQAAYGPPTRLDMLMFTVGDATTEESQEIAQRVHREFATRHGFDPKDKRALRVRNNLEQIERFLSIFSMVNVFIWILGLGTIMAGVIGVSNIMLIAVRERTKEFGIRKALGATPNSIVGMVLQEAVVLTTVAGYIGVVAGMGLIELVNKFVPPNPSFRNPSVELNVVFIATAVLIAAGALAGYIPARRAANVKPVAALRDE